MIVCGCTVIYGKNTTDNNLLCVRTVLRDPLNVLPDLVFIITLSHRYLYNFHFTGKETEAQRSSVT